MKSSHAGLLALGATLAGALAFRMTQPPSYINTSLPGTVLNPTRSTVQQVASKPVSAQVLNAPGTAYVVTAAGPQVVSAPAAVSPSTAATPDDVAVAPSPVYQEPAQPKPSPIPHPPSQQKAPAAQNAVPRLKPQLTAKAAIGIAPTQWAPQKYEAPAAPVASAAPSKAELEPPKAAEQQSPAPPLQVSQEQPPVESAPLPSARKQVEPRRVTLRTGMTVAVRLLQSLSSERNLSGDTFQATLAEPLIVDDLVIAERGARATGRVLQSERGRRFSNPAEIQVVLTSVNTSDGQRVALSTDPWMRQSEKSDDPLENLIGALARPRPATITGASVIRFRLASRITLTEQIATR